MKDLDLVLRLQEHANQLRARIIETSSRASLPHLGSCLSCVDLLVALYFFKLKIDPKNPQDPLRDRFILSKGHAAPALFQVLARRGFFPMSDLDLCGKNGSVFGEHPPTPGYLPGIEAATGSLGHGMPMGLGMAIASRINQLNYSVYTILGDGECNEGSIWECAMLAAAQKINNFCILVDFNKWQATDRSKNVMHLDSLAEKWSAFGWEVFEIDGHDYFQIINALSKSSQKSGKPVAIIAHTIKGKGVSFMEDDNNWHYRIPNSNEVALSKKELGVSS
ncbi:transketolase [Polynucleobacter sp. MWH-UH23A]|uniref:transketolase n=1 Tax=Polynucleobacter sp. MWH-UH23A TaxID=1855613 RepID=UPI003364BAB6